MRSTLAVATSSGRRPVGAGDVLFLILVAITTTAHIVKPAAAQQCTLCPDDADPLDLDATIVTDHGSIGCRQFKGLVPNVYTVANCHQAQTFQDVCGGCPGSEPTPATTSTSACYLCGDEPDLLPEPLREVLMSTGSTVSCQALDNAASYLDSSSSSNDRDTGVTLSTSCQEFRTDMAPFCCGEQQPIVNNPDENSGPTQPPEERDSALQPPSALSSLSPVKAPSFDIPKITTWAPSSASRHAWRRTLYFDLLMIFSLLFPLFMVLDA